MSLVGETDTGRVRTGTLLLGEETGGVIGVASFAVTAPSKKAFIAEIPVSPWTGGAAGIAVVAISTQDLDKTVYNFLGEYEGCTYRIVRRRPRGGPRVKRVVFLWKGLGDDAEE
jgi:hypothetical protein